MTEQSATHFGDEMWERQLEEMVQRLVRQAEVMAAWAAEQTERLNEHLHRMAERARRRAERAEAQAARMSARAARRAACHCHGGAEHELGSLGSRIERETMRAVERALRQMERELAQMDIEAVLRQVEESLAGIDIEGLTRQTEETIRSAAEQIQAALERRGYAAETGTPPRGEPVSDEERLAVLRMVENGIITAEEAERLLDALHGRRSR